jgi:hypothetical protein
LENQFKLDTGKRGILKGHLELCGPGEKSSPSMNDQNGMWVNMGRSAGDLEGVFEFDGETGYFYLYNVSGEQDQKIISAIQLISGAPDFNEDDITIRWSADERMVGLFVRSQLWAAFDSKTRTKHGGNYQTSTQPTIPSEIGDTFEG